MNVISISGNVTKDGEIRTIPSGESVLQFSVADNMIGKDKGAIFWNCSFWGKRGVAVADFIRKGQPVTVNGSISERSYVDKDGQQRKSIDVHVNDIALQGGKPQGTQEPREPRQAPTPSPRPQAQRTAPAAASGSGFDDFDSSDVPF
jgi:single-strand DNA-binding protein